MEEKISFMGRLTKVGVTYAEDNYQGGCSWRIEEAMLNNQTRTVDKFYLLSRYTVWKF